MQKRLQKKLHKGPFKEYGFTISGKLDETVDYDVFLDEFVAFLEKNQMQCGGGVRVDGFEFFVQIGTKKRNPSQQKSKILDWLSTKEDITSIQAGELIDAWN